MTISVLEVKKRLLALINDENLVNEYIRSYGPIINIKYIKGIKEKHMQSLRTTEEKDGDDPIFEILVRCPVCSQSEIVCYEMRAKTQAITHNKFNVPSYKGTSGFKSVDYSYIYVTVCPRCLFASPDKNDFIQKKASSAQETKSQLATNVILMLQEKIGERKALLKYIKDYEQFFKRPRTLEAAIMSLRLSCMRSQVEAWFELPYCFYKMGSYMLRIAKILKDSGQDNLPVLKEALGHLEEAFRTSNCPSEDIEMQVLYNIIALHLKLDDQKTANSYLAVFTNLKNARIHDMKTNSKLNTTIIDKWCNKAKFLWEERDNPDLFNRE